MSASTSSSTGEVASPQSMSTPPSAPATRTLGSETATSSTSTREALAIEAAHEPLAIEPPPSDTHTPIPPDIQTKPPGDIDMEGEEFHPSALEDDDGVESESENTSLTPDEVGRIWGVRPEAIQKKWEDMCKHIKDHWWSDPLGQFTHTETMERMNKEIFEECEQLFQMYYSENGAAFARWCEEQNIPSDAMMQELQAATESPERRQVSLQQYRQDMRFPYETLRIHIESLRRFYQELPKYPEGDARQKMESQFVSGVAVFTTILESADISSTSIAPTNMLIMLQKMMQRNPDEFKQALAWLDQATVAQRRAWEEAVAKMKNFIKIVGGPVNTTTKNRMMRLMADFKRLDAVIDQRNTEENRRKYNNLPILVLTEIHEAWLADIPARVEDAQQNLDTWLRSGNITSDLKCDILRELVKRETPDAAPNLSDIAEISANASEGLNDVERQIRASGELPDAPERSTEAASTKWESHSATTKAFSKEAAVALIMESRKKRRIPQHGSPNYLRGFTEYGVLVMTRPSVSPLAIYSRFFINAGTQANPFIIVKTGSEFSPGGAEALQDMKGNHTTFNLRERKIELKSNPIIKCGPAVQKSRSENYKARGRSREPDSYLFVEYADHKKEVLSKSELLALGTSTWAKRQMSIYLEEFQAKLKEFEMCKEWGLSPDTMELLTSEEREKYPWLVQEGLDTSQIQIKREEEEL